MNWLYMLLLLGAAGLVCWRVYGKFRGLRDSSSDDWDEQLVKNWRAQGGNAFAPVDIDFFFGVPTADACEPLALKLRAEGCVVDYHAAQSEGASGYTLRANKPVRVSVAEMQAHSARYRALAAGCGGSYDGWATEGITRHTESNQRLRARGVPASGYRRDLDKLK